MKVNRRTVKSPAKKGLTFGHRLIQNDEKEEINGKGRIARE